MSGADPDPLGTFESEYGSRGTRQIRGGKSAKCKREAYLRFPGENAPVVRPGGQARPLGTSKSWVPSESEEEEREVALDPAAVTERVVEVEVPVLIIVLRTLSSATPEGTRLVPKFAALFSVKPTGANPLLKSNRQLSSGDSSSLVLDCVVSEAS